MKVIRCDIPGPLIIEPDVHCDGRGFFLESWNKRAFHKAGIEADFVQDNHSRSSKGVLRGLHFQNPQAQGKLVRVIRGAVFDVIVDLRKSLPSFGEWRGYDLTAENNRMLWVPAGFAHGFLTLEDDTDLLYKCTSHYASEHEHILAWNDPDVAIAWPLAGRQPLLSAKDGAGVTLSEVAAFE